MAAHIASNEQTARDEGWERERDKNSYNKNYDYYHHHDQKYAMVTPPKPIWLEVSRFTFGLAKRNPMLECLNEYMY